MSQQPKFGKRIEYTMYIWLIASVMAKTILGYSHWVFPAVLLGIGVAIMFIGLVVQHRREHMAWQAASIPPPATEPSPQLKVIKGGGGA